MRPLQHLLGNFSRDFSRSTYRSAFGQCDQQTLVCQLCHLCRRFTQQGFCGDACQLTDKASAQRDKRTGHIKGSLRYGRSSGSSAVN